MTVDWTFLKEISVWQVCIVIIALWIVFRGLRVLWPGLLNTIEFINNIGRLSDFMEKTERDLKEIHHEVHYNNGGSVKDAVKRVEEGIRGLNGETNDIIEKVDQHIAHSVEWKSRLEQIDERTQPSSPNKKREE